MSPEREGKKASTKPPASEAKVKSSWKSGEPQEIGPQPPSEPGSPTESDEEPEDKHWREAAVQRRVRRSHMKG